MPQLIINSEYEKELENYVLGGDCVAFVGAGMSIPPGKDWRDTVEKIASRCQVSIDQNKSLPQIIDKCIEENEESCNQVCRELFPKHVVRSRTAIGHLLRLPFKAILTVNFDPWLHQQSRQQQYERCHIYPDLPLKESLTGGIYYIHGYFDSDNKNSSIRSLVFGNASFHKAYSVSILPSFLIHVFTYETVLFVGIDPTEENLNKILKKSISIQKQISETGNRQGDMPKKFVLWARSDDMSKEELIRDDIRISEIRSLAIKPVLYAKRANDYRGLEELLLSWVEKGDIRNRSAPFKSGFD